MRTIMATLERTDHALDPIQHDSAIAIAAKFILTISWLHQGSFTINPGNGDKTQAEQRTLTKCRQGKETGLGRSES